MTSQLGAKILQARKRAGLSQAALGTAVGVDGRTVRHWESGRHDPTADNVRRIEDALSVDLSGPDPTLTPEVIERALKEAGDAAFIAEFSRRLARRTTTDHDQGNVSSFGIKGVHSEDAESDDVADQGPA